MHNYFYRKLSEGELAGGFIPKDIDGVLADVVETGAVELHQYRERIRPAEPGYSINHEQVSGGTFGLRALRGVADSAGCQRMRLRPG